MLCCHYSNSVAVLILLSSYLLENIWERKTKNEYSTTHNEFYSAFHMSIHILTLIKHPSWQCHTIPSTLPSVQLSNHDSMSFCFKAGGFFISNAPCGTRRCTGCFLLPNPIFKETNTFLLVTVFPHFCYCRHLKSTL